MIEVKLKPCPFCGGKARYFRTQTLEGPMHKVRCTNFDGCQMRELQTQSFYRKEQAINAWNRRADDERSAKESEEEIPKEHKAVDG